MAGPEAKLEEVRRPVIFKYLYSWLYANFSKMRDITWRTDIANN